MGARFDGSFQEHQDARVRQGMTSLCFGSWLWKKPGNFAENEGGFNFFNEDPDRINPGFWQAADDRLEYMVDVGLVPGLGIGWPDQKVHVFGDDRLMRGLRYLIARYAAFNQDGRVRFNDLVRLMSAWGLNPDHRADLNGDGSVEFDDMLLLLGSWGE